MNNLTQGAKCARSIKTYMLLIVCMVTQHAFAQPVITALAPLSGGVGSAVTISGSNFNAVPANNIVYFGPVRAVVTGGSATSLTVAAPGGTGYQPVSVTANGLTAYSAKPFNVTFFSAGTINAVTFAPKVNYSNITTVTTGDFNGDGKPDIVGSSPGGYYNEMVVFQNNSTVGHDSLTKVLEVDGIGTDMMATGDFDGDGKLDIVTANHSGNYITIFKNTGSGGNIAFTIQGSNYTTGLTAITPSAPP